MELNMNQYTVFFNHPDDNMLEIVHINTLATRYVHLMFFGKLANEWGYGWDDIRFAQGTDLYRPHGTIMIHDSPLHYNIISGDNKTDYELATLPRSACDY